MHNIEEILSKENVTGAVVESVTFVKPVTYGDDELSSAATADGFQVAVGVRKDGSHYATIRRGVLPVLTIEGENIESAV